MSRWLLLCVGCALCAGCGTKLETGYEPNRLGLSLAQRRALYADPYTQQAQEAQADKAQDIKSRRPGTNY